MAFLLAVCTVLICLCLFKAEQCEDCGIEFEHTYVLEGEACFLECPPCSLLNNEDTTEAYNFTWFKKNINTSITTDILSRIHTVKTTVAFFPAKSEDAGNYSCVKRNSTSCQTKQVKLTVYKNVEGLCYTPETMYRQKLIAQSNDGITCPKLANFVAQERAQVTWFKECLPINSERMKPVGFMLQFENVIKADEGNYSCSISHYHNGQLLNVSRSIEVQVKDRLMGVKALLSSSDPLSSTPSLQSSTPHIPTATLVIGVPMPEDVLSAVIIYPTDEKLYVKTGSPVQLPCNISYTSNVFAASWYVNDDFAEDYFNSSRVTLKRAFDSILADGTNMKTLILDISAVERDDYGLKFVCVLHTMKFISEAYITLQPPAPDLHGPLIGCFVVLAFVIVFAVAAYKLFKIDIVLCYRRSLHPIMNKKDSDGKMYDAYVMFPRDSENRHVYPIDLFVLKVLPEVLEKQCGYKLFIFGRDDLPGEAVADVIDEAVKKSRRLMLILTRETSHKDFLYNEFEQSIVLHDSLLNSKTKIILIELEKIDYSKVPESVKYIKGKQGTITWKGDFTDKTLSPNTRFWKRVRYRMPPTYQSSSGTSPFIPAV